MKIGILGASNVGKTTIFNALTGKDIPTTVYSTTDAEPHIAVVKVPDERVDRLSEIYKPKKTTYATVEYVDYLGITKGDLQQNRKVLDLLKDVDAVVHVVRAFEDEAVVHPLGQVNPLKDAETIRLELIFSDLELVDKRLQRIEEARKKGRKTDPKEEDVLKKCKDALESETPLREVEFKDEEIKALRHLQFITIKPEVIVINMDEKSFNSEAQDELINAFQGRFKDPVIALSGKIEMELAQLDPKEQEAFLDELGINEPAMNRLIRVCYEHLGLISFFTVGDDEVRAWTIKRGTLAPKAAGKIHSDMERGFIRAEVINYNDFMSVGSMAEARQKALLRLEGKNYEVKDGDIINFRFNV